jgi:hypothetical protein
MPLSELEPLPIDWPKFPPLRDPAELVGMSNEARAIAESRDLMHQKLQWLMVIVTKTHNMQIAAVRERDADKKEREAEKQKRITAAGKLGIFVGVTAVQIAVSLIVHALTKSP